METKSLSGSLGSIDPDLDFLDPDRIREFHMDPVSNQIRMGKRIGVG